MSDTKPVILITGATSGIGKAGALELGRQGWKVFVHARSDLSGTPVLEELKKNAPSGDFSLVTGDFASLTQVKELAEQIKLQTNKLDVLWNNAGLTLNERVISADGWEMQMAVNHLAPFLLTAELIPFIETSQGRIITTSSGAALFGKFNWEDWMDKNNNYNPFNTYSKTKLANILFTYELARRFGPKGVTAHCFHPGQVRTEFGKRRGVEQTKSRMPDWLVSLLFINSAVGADTGVFLAQDPSVKKSNGKFWIKRKINKLRNRFINEDNAVKLWKLTEEATRKIF